MNNLQNLVCASGVMPTLFADQGAAPRVIRAIEQTEMPVVEILQRDALAKEILKEACKIKKTALVGAGTVCTIEACKEMVDLGADFIVSPAYDQEIVDFCVQRGIPVVPGVTTTSQVMAAYASGVTLLKAFPFQEAGGTAFFSSIAGPFPGVQFVATGCLDDRNLSLVSHPRIAAVGGVWMFQAEDDHTVLPEEKIVERLTVSIQISRHYKKGWQ